MIQGQYNEIEVEQRSNKLIMIFYGKSPTSRHILEIKENYKMLQLPLREVGLLLREFGKGNYFFHNIILFHF